jgi:hypothetical protein
MLLIFSTVLKHRCVHAVVQPSTLVKAKRPSGLEVKNAIVGVRVSNLHDSAIKFTGGAMSRDDAIVMVSYTHSMLFRVGSLT